jgi:hypothetical protein
MIKSNGAGAAFRAVHSANFLSDYQKVESYPGKISIRRLGSPGFSKSCRVDRLVAEYSREVG